jgi:hypothetical protein
MHYRTQRVIWNAEVISNSMRNFQRFPFRQRNFNFDSPERWMISFLGTANGNILSDGESLRNGVI